MALGGCATTSPFNQPFLEVRSPHFEILSSLGEQATLQLAQQLEAFHLGARAVMDPAAAGRVLEPIRVIAFDDRGFGRPFSVRGQTAYFLSEPDEGVLVIRAPGGWDRRVGREVLHDIAHRWLRGSFRERLPLWLEEGLAQTIGASRPLGDRVQIGTPIPDFVLELRDWKRSELAEVIEADDLSESSTATRRLFDAQAWALVHRLRFDPQPGERKALKVLLSDEGGGEAAVRRRAIATLTQDPDALADRLFEHYEREDFPVEIVGLAEPPVRPRAVPVPPARARRELGWLALAIGQRRLAEEYFERALDQEAESPEALVGLAHASRAPFEEVRAQLRRADRLAGDQAEIQARLGDAYRSALSNGATSSGASSPRASARRHYRRSLELDPRGVRARMGLGLLELGPGGDPERGLVWLETAARLRPGSLAVDLARARLQLQRGRLSAARLFAREVASRGHDPSLVGPARMVLEEARAARRR